MGGLRRGFLALGLAAPRLPLAGEITPEQQEIIVASRIGQVLPGVVGILVEVGAEVTLNCGKNDVYVVKPEPNRENATGFIIHPDGWIATNGHVVKSVYTDDEEHIANFLRQAADAACGPALGKVPESQRKMRMDAILKDPENRKGVRLAKKIEVYLPTLFGARGQGPHGNPCRGRSLQPAH